MKMDKRNYFCSKVSEPLLDANFVPSARPGSDLQQRLLLELGRKNRQPTPAPQRQPQVLSQTDLGGRKGLKVRRQ